MDDLDPAAPIGNADEGDARRTANFGVDGTGDFPPGDPGLDLPPSFAVATITFSVQKAMQFLQQCETSQPRVTYGLGKKIAAGQVPGRDFTQVDCSGFVRETIRWATDLGDSFPDGSVVQHDWVKAKGFAADTVASGSSHDGAVRIAFLPPGATASGIGHVALIHNGMTIESHGEVGPDSRPWTDDRWQAKTSLYILADAD